MTTAWLNDVSWRFGGPLGAVAPAVAWSVLAVAGVAGLAWIAVSYRRTLVELPAGRRRALTVLRFGLFGLMLVLLAGPVKTSRDRMAGAAPRPGRPLAVLVDRSASMVQPDNRGRSRADDAQRRWRVFAPSATGSFSAVKTYAFAEELAPVAGETVPPVGEQTHLFSSLERLLADAPPGGWGGVVTLTDGLDTRGALADAAEAAVTAARQAGTPLYFVPGRNRYAGGPFVQLRDWTVPAQVVPRSGFRLEVTLDAYQTEARSIPIRLRVGGTWRPAETLRLGAGRRMIPWGTEITAEESGPLPVELEVGEGPQAVHVRAEVQVRSDHPTRILYHQGALDWGYRFLADVLRRDPAFTLTPIFHIAPSQMTAAARERLGGRPLPADPAGYADCDIVVLANTSAAQLSAAQQAALTAWVRGGGVLIFLTPDDASTQGFAGSELEKMLPVVFAGADPAAPSVSRQRLRDLRGGGHFDGEAVALSEFSWEPAATRIFGRDEMTSPRFINYARVQRAKPGAEVLARHPGADGPEGGKAILLAVQRYGQGQSAVLTSDALWRWKLNQPSSERHVEKFWQNLFAWLGRERGGQLRFDHAPLNVPLGREVELRLAGPAAPAARLIAHQGDTTIALDPAPAESPASRLFRWTPSVEGEWQLTATDASGSEIHHWLQVAGTSAGGERSGAPPDEALLARLAARTGGTVLEEDGAPPAWREPGSGGEPAASPEVLRPLWHQAWVLAALVGGYALELVLRRRWRLL